MVDPIITAAAIEGGSQILGGVLGGGGTSKRMQAALQREERMFNYNMQKEFAQHGIRWRVEDAKAAGLHPTVAAGIQPTSAIPMSSVGSPVGDRYGVGDVIRDAGSAASRAIASKQTPVERLNADFMEQQVRGAKLDNDIKMMEINSKRALLDASQLPPPMPPGGYRDSSGSPYSGAEVPMYDYVRTPFGTRRVVSDAYGQKLENDWTEYFPYITERAGETARYYGRKFRRFMHRFVD